MKTKYLLAQFIPDLGRMEPKNIGVIVWNREGAAARFVGERAKGKIDGRELRTLAVDQGVYTEWVNYWKSQINQNTIMPPKGGEAVPRSSEKFLECLVDSSRGNFVLKEGGYLFDKVSIEELGDVAEYLFAQLVKPVSEEPSEVTLDGLCERIVNEARLQEDANFKTNYVIRCPIRKNGTPVTEDYEFSYAYQNGKLKGLYHKVSLPYAKERLARKNVDACAWMFEKVIGAELIEEKLTGALVYIPQNARGDKHINKMIDVLKLVTRVFDVSDPEQLRSEFIKLSA